MSLGREEVCLEYKPSVKEGDFLTALKQAADRDRLLTYTTVGIHRDDLVLNIGDYAVRKIGSQGQKKTFLIALKLAQYHWLHQMSEVKIVGGEMFGQVFITDTNRGHIDDILRAQAVDYKLFTVTGGEIS